MYEIESEDDCVSLFGWQVSTTFRYIELWPLLTLVDDGTRCTKCKRNIVDSHFILLHVNFFSGEQTAEESKASEIFYRAYMPEHWRVGMWIEKVSVGEVRGLTLRWGVRKALTHPTRCSRAAIRPHRRALPLRHRFLRWIKTRVAIYNEMKRWSVIITDRIVLYIRLIYVKTLPEISHNINAQKCGSDDSVYITDRSDYGICLLITRKCSLTIGSNGPIGLRYMPS